MTEHPLLHLSDHEFAIAFLGMSDAAVAELPRDVAARCRERYDRVRCSFGRDRRGNGEAPPGEHGEPDGLLPPTPLPSLPPVPEFPIDILPDALQAWVADAAERAQFAVDFAAVAAMVALGSVIGRKIGVRLKARDDWTEYANVWGGLIGCPSSLKSPAMREALRPFKALQAAADAGHESAMAMHAAELDAFKLRRDAKRKATAKALTKNPDAEIDLGNDVEPEEPVARTYWTSNVNEASLGALFQVNPNGLLLERDELSSLLASLEDDGKADLRGMLLSGWSGNEGYRFDRILRGTIAIPKYALSILGSIQPGPLERYVRGAFSGERADGLLQRFQLLVWPDAKPFEHVDRWPGAKAKSGARDLFERADTLDPLAIGSKDDYGDDPPFIRLSDEAQAMFNGWYVPFMSSRRALETDGSETGPLASHFGKYPGLVGKLSLVIHVADDPSGKRVSERTMHKALAWLDYLAPHARRVYHASEYPETGAAKLLLARLTANDLPQRPFKARDIYRKAWHGLTDHTAVKKACRLLFELGWLIEIDQGGSTGGRPADPLYAVSPSAAGLSGKSESEMLNSWTDKTDKSTLVGFVGSGLGRKNSPSEDGDAFDATDHEGDSLPTTDAERRQEIYRARELAWQWRIEGHMGGGLSREDAEILASGELYETFAELVLGEAGYPPDAITAAIDYGRDSPVEMLRDWLAMAERIAAERSGRTLQ